MHERYENGAPHSDLTRQVDADIVIAMLSFVDNWNLSNTGPKHKYLKAILKRTEHDAQLWNDLIRASGAAEHSTSTNVSSRKSFTSNL